MIELPYEKGKTVMVFFLGSQFNLAVFHPTAEKIC